MGEDAVVRREHGAVSAKRIRANPVDFPQGEIDRVLREGGLVRRARSGAREARVAIRRDHRPRRARAETTSPDELPLGLGKALQRVYEHCPVIQSDEPTRSSRLVLCDVTAKTLARGLELLGIEHPEQM